MVTPDPPVKDVKNAQATAVTIAGPPRNEPNNAAKQPNRQIGAICGSDLRIYQLDPK